MLLCRNLNLVRIYSFPWALSVLSDNYLAGLIFSQNVKRYIFRATAVIFSVWRSWQGVQNQGWGREKRKSAVYASLNLLLRYHDCDPWQPGILQRAWEEIKASLSVSHAAKHQFPLIQRAETKALNRTVTDQSQAGEGCLCPSNKVTEKTFTICRSSTPPSVCEETQSDSLRWYKWVKANSKCARTMSTFRETQGD